MGIQYNLISFTSHRALENWIKVIQAAQALVQASSLPGSRSLESCKVSLTLSPLVASMSTPVEPLSVLEPAPGSSEYRSPCSRGREAGSQVVAGSRPLSRHSSDFYQLFPLPFHGRMSYGMGSTSGGRHAPRKMGASRTASPHQSVGNASGGQGP